MTIAGSQIDITDSRFVANVADVSGGGIYNDQATSLSLTDVTLATNIAGERYGGGIANEGDLTAIGGAFTDNSAPIHGGALSSNIGTVRIEAVTITGNHSTNAGAIGNYLGGEMTLVNNVIESNRATGDAGGGLGGAIVNDRDSHLLVQGGRIARNRARSSGGALYNTVDATLELVDVTIDGNQVDQVNGGGLTNEGSATITGGEITNNNSPLQAGGIICNGGDLAILDAQITANTSGNGGGLSNSNGCVTRLERTRVQDNQATASNSFGGGLLNDLGTVQLISSTFSGNSSVFVGGAFSNNNPAGLVELDGATIADNFAAEGPAFVNFGIVRVRNSTITDDCVNHAQLDDLGGNSALCTP
ncbi:MAG: hypothetical protein GVY22_10140 [Gammaproteobacteria bacterium]|nr:hypothetical protein [Gammaproteobacteria bacterium]